MTLSQTMAAARQARERAEEIWATGRQIGITNDAMVFGIYEVIDGNVVQIARNVPVQNLVAKLNEIAA